MFEPIFNRETVDMWSEIVWNKSEGCQNIGISRVLDKIEGRLRYQNLRLNLLSALAQQYVMFVPIFDREMIDMWSERVGNKSESCQNIGISRVLDKSEGRIKYLNLRPNPLSALVQKFIMFYRYLIEKRSICGQKEFKIGQTIVKYSNDSLYFITDKNMAVLIGLIKTLVICLIQNCSF